MTYSSLILGSLKISLGLTETQGIGHETWTGGTVTDQLRVRISVLGLDEDWLSAVSYHLLPRGHEIDRAIAYGSRETLHVLGLNKAVILCSSRR